MTGPRTITTSRSSTIKGKRLARRRLPEGLDGHHRAARADRRASAEEWADLEPGRGRRRWCKVGIETDRGPWVPRWSRPAIEVFAINPMSVARYRERHSTSGAKSDAGDAHVLAEIVRLDRAHHRPVAGDSAQAEAIKLVARAHQTPDLGPDPARCCGCARRCGSSSPPRWTPSPTSTPPTRWSCWPGARPRPGPPG